MIIFLTTTQRPYRASVHPVHRMILLVFLVVTNVKSRAAVPQTDTIPTHTVIKGQAQGTTYLIRYLPTSQTIGKHQIDSLLNEIDRSLSLYRQDSKISQLNRANTPFPSDPHLAKVLGTALKLQQLSDGSFDFRLFKLSQAWGFGPAPAKRHPSAFKIKRLKPKPSDSVWLVGNRIHKSHPRLQIDLDGIAQGYSVDVIASFLEQCHIYHYMVELGGEIRTSGHRPDGSPWRIGVESPVDSEKATTLMVAPGDGAITTSGSYRKTRSFGGHIYSHVIDPKTGRPIENGMLSCTVIAPTAILADALDNVGMVLGPEAFLKIISRFPSVEAFLVWGDERGGIQTRSTAGFHQRIIEQIPPN